MPGQETEDDSRRYMVVYTDDLATLDEAIDQLKDARSGSDNAYEVAEVWVLPTANPEELRPMVKTELERHRALVADLRKLRDSRDMDFHTMASIHDMLIEHGFGDGS